MLSNKKLHYSLIVFSVVCLLATVKFCSEKELNVIQEEEEKYTASCFDNVYLSGDTDPFQKIELFKAEDQSYYAFLPSEMRTNVRVQFSEFQELQIGETLYKSGDELTDIYKNEPYRMIARDWDGDEEETTLRFCFSINVPTVYIESDTDTMDAVNADKSVKANVQYAAISEMGELSASGQCKIKARGNTSFDAEQKSYSIKFNSPESLFGMGEASEWVLLANYDNSTQQLKNKIVLDVAKMLGMPYTPENCFVNVFINNQYNGLYLLTQKISADGGSVHIDDAAFRSNLTGPYLLEFDARYESEPVWFRTDKKDVVVKYPKTVSEESLTYISNYIQNVEKSIFSGNDRLCFEYIDMDSWAKMYLMQEFFVQFDVEFASFYLYKYVENPLIYAGPVWDFDLAYGSMYSGYYPKLTQKTGWLKNSRSEWLTQLDTYQRFHDRWAEEYLQTMSPIISTYLENFFNDLVNTIASASYMNAMRWNRGAIDFSNDAETIRSWISGRKEFLDAYLGGESLYVEVLFHFGWGTMSYYIKKGEKLSFLPMREYGEIDRFENKESYGNMIGWQDMEGEFINADSIITKDIDFYAIYE